MMSCSNYSFKCLWFHHHDPTFECRDVLHSPSLPACMLCIHHLYQSLSVHLLILMYICMYVSFTMYVCMCALMNVFDGSLWKLTLHLAKYILSHNVMFSQRFPADPAFDKPALLRAAFDRPTPSNRPAFDKPALLRAAFDRPALFNGPSL